MRVATKGASIYKDYSRVVKVEPTVATRKETPARPWREEPVVTKVNVLHFEVAYIFIILSGAGLREVIVR